MSTSGRTGQPAQPAAETDTTSSGRQPAGGPAGGGTPGTDPQAGAVPAAPHGQAADAMTVKRTGEADSQPTAEERPVDEAELRQEIERTREQLGETVDQLAAKADVQGRARAKAAKLAGRAKSTTAQARTQAAAQFGSMRGQLAGRSAVARQKVAAAGGTAKTQLQARAAPLREATPEPLRRAMAKGASTAQQRRVPLAMAAVTLIAGYLVFRWWRKR
jgi:hypothetical protein